MEETSLHHILTTVLYGTCLVGVTGNMIILASYFIKWKRLKSLQTCDKILSFLAISRALCFINVLLSNVIFRFLPWVIENKIMLSAFSIQTVFIFYSSQWIATILCVFYCVKIVTYNYKLLIFLRTRISIMVPRMILASLIISLISSLPMGWYGYDLKLQNVSNYSPVNIMELGGVPVPNLNNQFLIFALGSFPPFIIFCASISLLIHFLLIHTRRMRSNESHIQSPNLTSHFDVVKSMSLFLLLQIMYFIGMNVLISVNALNFKFLIPKFWLILCSLLLLHSLYMIYTSSEVRKMLSYLCLCPIRGS